MERRVFLKNSFVAGLPLAIPDLLFKVLPARPFGPRNLVYVQLSGGNDWYNTIIPRQRADYLLNRPSIAVREEEIIPIDPDWGFHPAMAPLKRFYDQGHALILNELPCEHGDNSHYTAAQLWNRGEARQDASVSGPVIPAGTLRVGKEESFQADLLAVSDEIIRSDKEQVYTVQLDGFDTHQFQKYKHSLLLETFSMGMSTFIDELVSKDRFRNTLIVIWSEFGRSFTENNRKGTDHGNKNMVILVSGTLPVCGIRSAEHLKIADIHARARDWTGEISI